MKPAWRLWTVAVVANVAIAALFLADRTPGTHAAWSGLPLDDGWIHLVYARSLGRLHGLAYNPGQPETGFTSPLWVVLLAPLFWVVDGVGAAVAAKIVGVALGVVASVLAHRLTLRLTGSRAAAWIALVALALEPALAFARVSGMEVALAATVTLFALLRLADDDPARAGPSLALLPLARPELTVLVLLALPLLIARLLRTRAGARPWLRALGPLALAALAWSGDCLLVTGHPLPATFYAKHDAGGFDDLDVLGQMIAGWAWFAHGAGLLLAALGAVVLLRARRPAARVLVAGTLALPLATTWAHPLKQAEPFYWNRYVMPVLPLVMVLLAAGAGTIVAWARARRWLAAAPGAALLLIVAWRWPRAAVAAAHRYARNCQNVNEMQVAIGRWITAHAAPDDVVATNDAGAIRFLGDRRTVDLVGLNDHELLFGDAHQVILREQPRFVAVFPSWFPQALRDPRFRIVYRAAASDYSICDCPGQRELLVFERIAPY